MGARGEAVNTEKPLSDVSRLPVLVLVVGLGLAVTLVIWGVACRRACAATHHREAGTMMSRVRST
jgi:hypothetical protein